MDVNQVLRSYGVKRVPNPRKKDDTFYKKKTSEMQSYNKETLSQHFSDLTKEDLIDTFIELGKEGKNVHNILNQRLLAKKLNGKFVGDVEDNWDIEVYNLKIELKSQVTVAPGSYAGSVGFGDWEQKEGWDLLVHHLPEKFNTFLDEDRFLVFEWSDRGNLLKYCDANFKMAWTASIYNHTGNFRRNKEKVEWLLTKVVNLEGLKKIIHEKTRKSS
jgi:hypothetical protein